MKNSGSLIDDDVARSLSHDIYPLGDQVRDICEELNQSGFGSSAAVMREAFASAGGPGAMERLWVYWTESAKERLAGLAGPANVLSGRFPATAAYRSNYLDELRQARAKEALNSSGSAVSPQIEPTLRSYYDTATTQSSRAGLIQKLSAVTRRASEGFEVGHMPEFGTLSGKARYELLIQRYSAALLPAGFRLDSHRKSGLVFRKLTSNGRWAFLFVDDSLRDIEHGQLVPMFGLTLPKKAVLPSALPLSSVATFSPENVVPGFNAACYFDRSSYPEFCLAADSCAALAKVVFTRLDRLLD